MLLIRPFTEWPTRWHAGVALLAAMLVAGLSWHFLEAHRHEVADLQHSLKEERAAFSGLVNTGAIQGPPALIDPSTWPLRLEADDVVRWATEVASNEGLTIQSVNISHRTQSSQNWGAVTLSLSTQGSYSAHKVWQGALQARFDALAVRSVRLQNVLNTQGGQEELGLAGSWVWVLYVRD